MTYYAARGKRLPEYRSWLAMRRRCYDPKTPSFPRYGGRGITVCEEWRSDFLAFLSHIGPKPSLFHTVDRKDSAKNYEPGNVQWSTPIQQARNRRSNKVHLFEGVPVSEAELAERFGIGRSTIAYRTDKLGWPIEKALTEKIKTPQECGRSTQFRIEEKSNVKA